MPLRTPLSQARGLGSAKEGAEHFVMQRLTGLANLFLVFFLIYTVFRLAGADYSEVRSYFHSPLTSALTVLLLLSASYHMKLGMQVIIEDYVHGEGAKIALLALNVFYAAFIGVTGVIAVLKLSLGA
jgi:succinate dehydrogenase / fumarate reductase membrane anchor subunit